MPTVAKVGMMVSIRYACKASCDRCAIISHFKGGISPLVEDDICVLFDISMIFKPSNIEKNGGKVTLSRINNIIIYCLEIDIPDSSLAVMVLAPVGTA